MGGRENTQSPFCLFSFYFSSAVCAVCDFRAVDSGALSGYHPVVVSSEPHSSKVYLLVVPLLRRSCLDMLSRPTVCVSDTHPCYDIHTVVRPAYPKENLKAVFSTVVFMNDPHYFPSPSTAWNHPTTSFCISSSKKIPFTPSQEPVLSATPSHSLSLLQLSRSRSRPSFQGEPCSPPPKRYAGSSHGSVHFKWGHTSCLLCKSCFSGLKAFQNHLLIHDGKRPFACDKCSKTFRQRGHCDSHQRIHTGEKPFACLDRTCSKRFKDGSGANSHYRRHHLLVVLPPQPSKRFVARSITPFDFVFPHVAPDADASADLCTTGSEPDPTLSLTFSPPRSETCEAAGMFPTTPEEMDEPPEMSNESDSRWPLEEHSSCMRMLPARSHPWMESFSLDGSASGSSSDRRVCTEPTPRAWQEEFE